jgi:hypothetical protein
MPATDVNNNGTACLIFIRPPTPVIPEEKDRKEARGEQRAARRFFLLPRRSSAYMMYLIRIKP